MADSGGKIIRASDTDFKLSDPGFYLDARLTAMVNGHAYDFMGKKIFTTSFFRQNVGFGITNIDIEVNTSLQPLITITFKDLYGNAVFGKNINKALTAEISDAINVGANSGESDVSDFSILFNWPPPKFLFTFKGFLGKQVSWLLNLKKTSTTYQSDGSYDIKCEFVPNQWGFMADLPFLFLLAVKGLKKKELDSAAFKEVRTIFDLIKIGKQVEIKTKETTKEFDVLMKQMTLLKANRIVEAITISKVIKFDETINGSVGNLTVKGTPALPFKNVKINTPLDPNIRTIENIKKNTSSSADALRKVNTYMLLNADIGDYKSKNIAKLDQITFDQGTKLDGQLIESEIKQRLKVITDNILDIEDAIKQRSFDSSKTQLQQITIGEVFKHLAMDAGYILGKILQTGYDTYNNPSYKDLRDSLSKTGEIAGKQYPLMFDDTIEKKEVPAIGKNIGVEEGELAFVDDFISAVSEGIAKDLIRDNQAGGASAEETLTKRINNIECIQGNPYAPFYRSIAENIMIRAGIIGYLTRSNDPNFPGDFDTSWGGDRDSIEEVLKLADADMENVTTGMLSEMSDEEFAKLKQFCIFWNRFISTDGLTYLNNLPTTTDIALLDKEDGTVDTSGFDGALPDSLLNRQVTIERNADNVATSTKTLLQIMAEVFSPKPGADNPDNESGDASNASFIYFYSLQATAVYNNKIIYSLPTNIVGDDSYVYALFEGTDATKAKEANNASSDAETRSKDPDDTSIVFSNPVAAGLVPIDTFAGKTDPTVPLPRIDKINARFPIAVLKYQGMANPVPALFKPKSAGFTTTFDAECVYSTTAPAKIVDPNGVITDPTIQIPATNLVYSVAMHPNKPDGGLVFGPFCNESNSGQNHRACIKQMCVTLLNKMNKLEEEKNQIISDVLGKATEQREAMYKQFNVLYHQWESLMYEDAKMDDDFTSSAPIDSTKIADGLSDRYKTHTSTSVGTNVSDIGTNAFVYDYPLNNKADLKVDTAIIDLAPLYSPNGNTTVLSIIQQICTKNNFMFIPIPGNGNFKDYRDLFSPHVSTPVSLKNFFYVMFMATPESRATLSNDNKDTPISSSDNTVNDPPGDAYEVKVGSPDNKIFKSINIDTNENKTTAEGIVNLQRLVDKENQNKTVTTNCSMLPVLEGRSYKASFDMLGNAQVFPMQYFYLNSIPLFNGIYQVLKVKHSIRPNDMTTTAEGIRMRFSFQTGEFGGIPPITLQSLEDLDVLSEGTEDASAVIKKFNAQSGNTTPATSSNPPGASASVPDTIDACPPATGILNEPIVTSIITPNAYGGFIKGKTSFVKKVDAAYKVLQAQGINLSIGDSYRSFDTQKAAYLNFLENKKLQQEGKSWTKNGVNYPASVKPDNIAHPCKGYHVRGQAMDINQTAFNKTDIQSHGKIYKALYDAGLRRIPNEWWHWSIEETNPEINKKFTDHGGDSPTATQY
jgi:hypothetical protein